MVCGNIACWFSDVERELMYLSPPICTEAITSYITEMEFSLMMYTSSSHQTPYTLRTKHFSHSHFAFYGGSVASVLVLPLWGWGF